MPKLLPALAQANAARACGTGSAPVAAPATGFTNPFGPPAPEKEPEFLSLNGVMPAVEGEWTVETVDGPVAVTTVFAFVKKEMLANYSPEQVAEITGVSAGVTRYVARQFATRGPGMIFAGYRANKWLNGDLILRSWLLMCALTGNTGREGGGVQTFNQLYPLAHAFLGIADVIGRQNVISPSLGVIVKPMSRTKLGVRGYAFWRASTDDAVYGASGAPMRAGSAGSASEVGSEIDVWLDHRFDRHWTGLAGYSHFFAGEFIEQSGAHQDIDFYFVQAQYTF